MIISYISCFILNKACINNVNLLKHNLQMHLVLCFKLFIIIQVQIIYKLNQLLFIICLLYIFTVLLFNNIHIFVLATDGESHTWFGSDRDYTYDELLTRVFEIMREKNPDMVAGKKQKFVMRPPQVVRIGTKKTSFANFTEICKT